MRRAVLALVLVPALVATAGCGTAVKAGGEPGPALGGGYVALGDSYTAAPGVPTTDTSACLQSDHDYPHLLAAQVEATSFTDVSCSGATTASVVSTQLSAVVPGTALVTLGIGANDLGISGLLLGACFQVALGDPAGAPCQAQYGGQLAAALPAAAEQVAATLTLLRQRAPQSRIVLVGYPQLLPAAGTCPELPYAAGDYPYLRQVFADLDTLLASAASRGGADYVSLLAPSEGHDVCAGEDAWVQGIQGDPAQAIALHPRLAGQQAAADLVLAELS